MDKPVLVIMAAGMGSRFGGLKQIEPVDEYGHIIMDFSIYDARRAGFEEVVFIIKRENEALFREVIGDRLSRWMKVHYVFQELENLPDGYQVPQGRTKPWGTAHAVMSCIGTVRGPFAVINADDYYGVSAFRELYQYLTTHQDDDKYRYAMVGYVLRNTLTENGTVARGVCQTDDRGYLTGITERTKIRRDGDGAAYTEDGEHWTELCADTPVSMNMWAFTPSILEEIRRGFGAFLESGLKENPMKCEYFLPGVVDALMREDRATVQVLRSEDRWYGVTYLEDKPMVVEAFRKLRAQGVYPEKLWEEET